MQSQLQQAGNINRMSNNGIPAIYTAAEEQKNSRYKDNDAVGITQDL